MVLIVLCFGVDCLCCLSLMYIFIFKFSAAYWGIAAQSAYDMFSWYKYLSVILVVFFSHPSVRGVGISF